MEKNRRIHILCARQRAKATYILLESISCDRLRPLLTFAEENTVGLIRSSNVSLVFSPNVFSVGILGCGTVFG